MRAGREARLAELDGQAREIKTGLNESLRQINEIQMEIHKIELNVDALRRDVQEKYFVDLGSLLADSRRIEEERKDRAGAGSWKRTAKRSKPSGR